MKWCRFEAGGAPSYGLIEGEAILVVNGSPFDGYTQTSTTYALSSVKLLAPVIPPSFYAAGVNYREHVTQMAKIRGVEPQFPPAADVGYRANNALLQCRARTKLYTGDRGRRGTIPRPTGFHAVAAQRRRTPGALAVQPPKLTQARVGGARPAQAGHLPRAGRADTIGQE
ncbi:MAG TPA: DUF2437 domain-containing protein [Dehalococcoidia bacterium]|nr:DUF2437 domain-containing protein [Dehalococcoidia bacterium]